MHRRLPTCLDAYEGDIQICQNASRDPTSVSVYSRRISADYSLLHARWKRSEKGWERENGVMKEWEKRTERKRENDGESPPERFLPDRDFSSALQLSDSLFRRSRPPAPNHQLPTAKYHCALNSNNHSVGSGKALRARCQHARLTRPPRNSIVSR